MQQIETEVLVIGGGATGTGVLRDLAMRGFGCILVEKRDLNHGTTGRFHGLLHSGGRYVVRDPEAAAECIRENRILRRIMPQCIEDTGGFFVTTPWDDPAYADNFLIGCRTAGIPVEEVSIGQMLREEPMLNPEIARCFRVPDGSADSFLASEANVNSAREYGARALMYHEVGSLLLENGRIVGAKCRDLVGSEDLVIRAQMVVNSSGAWAGQIASTVGVDVPVRPSKGTMIGINHRVVNTVINRCKMPSDGDIAVPAHTITAMGTTDEAVRDPEHFVVEPWEIRLMLEEGEKVLPGLSQMRVLRAWAGVRPLYVGGADTDDSDSREVTRGYALLDHESRDGVEGLVTIIGGKWTTYRLMAEDVVDRVCEKLDTVAQCRTHQESLAAPEGQTYHWLGAPLRRAEDSQKIDVVCECELSSCAEVEQAIISGACTIDDVRRDVRLGMGPCQGAFCTYRATGIMHRLRQPEAEESNLAMRDFLQERWKGALPVLGGQQLRQERLKELIYVDVLNADHLPGPTSSRLACVMYDETEEIQPGVDTDDRE